ncbi:MAG: tripartite tricarboxylate transporter substrate binding protein, partial [Burkholderiaceae bacterium]|nr:tripartite tricarboxylate transporter substrate binding protein [Burkholderiaceae bacterium]
MKLLSTLLATAMLAIAPAAMAQTFPDKPIMLVVGFPPGGGVDIVARQLAETLSDQLGQRVIVENKAGAAGNVAMEYVARAKPDGYTLLMGNLGMLAANPVLYPKLSFDAARDFVPVARVVVTPLLAAVPATLPVQNMGQFIAMAKAKPGQLNFGSGGNGNINHMAGEMLKLQTGTQITHVPYKGSAPALTDLVAGHIQLIIDGFNVVQPSVAGGRVRAIAVTGETRSPQMPDVPTMKEATGLTDFVIYGWQGVLAPAATPPALVERISQEVAKALANPALKARLSGQGTEPAYQGPAQFRSYIAGEQTRWANV